MADTGSNRLWRLLAIFLGAAVATGVAVIGLNYFGQSSNSSQIDRAFEQVKQMPLVGVVLAENPGLEAKVRQAIEAELANPTKSGPNRVFLFGVDVRKQYIVPALRNSDDEAALAAIKDMSELVQHLQTTNVDMCREFGAVGLTRPDKLDTEGLALFKRALAAQEDAYRNGKATPASRPATSDSEITRILTDAGYKPADFQQLSNYKNLSANDACAAMAKLYTAPGLLPAARGAIVARYLLTISQ
jgi:hypothetical protein